MMDKRLGRRIREQRERLGVTQAQFAERLNLSCNYYARLERGDASPRLDTLIKIINSLGVSADAILQDVLDYSSDYVSTELSKQLAGLPPDEQKSILQVTDLLIQQSKARVARNKEAV